MRFGVCVPNYGVTGTTATVKAVALEAESLGYDSVWCTDHILMPKNSGTPYEEILESMTTLAFLASETRRVRLAVSSLVMPLRNPITVAKQLATIDNLSNGRIILATGAGWNETELSYLGSNFHDRGKRLDESIRLIRKLWSGGPNPEQNSQLIVPGRGVPTSTRPAETNNMDRRNKRGSNEKSCDSG